MSRAPFLALLAMLSCGGDSEPAGPTTEPLNTDQPAEPPVPMVSRAALISSLTFVEAVGDVTSGFDIDGHDSEAGDDEGCGHADRVDDEGRTGIDNAFAGLVPVLNATEASALTDLLRQSIANGELLLLVEVQAPEDDPDGCETVTVWRGIGVPLLGADSEVLDNQTLSVRDPVTAPCEWVADGVVEARGFEVDLVAQVLDVAFDLHLRDVALRLELGDDGWSGVLGAGIPLSDFATILSEDDLGELQELLTPIIENLADLFPDDEGQCTAVSATLRVEALPAFVDAP